MHSQRAATNLPHLVRRNPCRNGGETRAFTRLELAGVLAALALLTSVVLPLLAGTGARAERVVCINNLRQIGQGFTLWSTEHEGTFAWQSLWDTNQMYNAGTRGHRFHEELWFQFFCLSNEIKSPAILVCPSDQQPSLKVATAWNATPQGGLMNPSYRNNALSYPLDLHADPLWPKTFLSLDRNVTTAGRGPCGTYDFKVTAYFDFYPSPPFTIWTNAIHGEQGNLLYVSGQVEEANQAVLRQACQRMPDRTRDHVLFPF